MTSNRLRLLLPALLLTGCALLPPEAEPPAPELLAPVMTERERVTIRRGPIESRLHLTAVVGAERQAVLYFRTGGRLRSLHSAAGHRVESGQLLAELEAGSLPFDLRQAELELERTRLVLDDAIARQGFAGAPSELQIRQYELDLRQRELALERLQAQLAEHRLHAPFAGQVLSVARGQGDPIEPYGELLVLAGDGPLLARARVDEFSAAQLRAGQRAEIFLPDGDPAPIPATVTAVPPIGAAGADLIIVVTPDAPSPRLAPGRNGRVEVILERKPEALLVPRSALNTYGGRQFVTVVQGETRQEVSVEIGIQTEQWAEVLSGLEAGDQVVGR